MGINEGKAELSTQKYRVVSSNQTYRGEINVGVTFTAHVSILFTSIIFKLNKYKLFFFKIYENNFFLYREKLIMSKTLVDGRKAHFSHLNKY